MEQKQSYCADDFLKYMCVLTAVGIVAVCRRKIDDYKTWETVEGGNSRETYLKGTCVGQNHLHKDMLLVYPRFFVCFADASVPVLLQMRKAEDNVSEFEKNSNVFYLWRLAIKKETP